MWVFGYGSLIWRPGFPFLRKELTVLNGYARRFWQGSPDHRGTPEAPGRVVTLIPMPGDSCWGMAYQLEPESQATTLRKLDIREQGGYERRMLSVNTATGETLECLVYVGSQTNPEFLGPAPFQQMVEHIRGSVGPSGKNPEYVVRLAEALREIGIVDDHVFELADAVRNH